MPLAAERKLNPVRTRRKMGGRCELVDDISRTALSSVQSLPPWTGTGKGLPTMLDPLLCVHGYDDHMAKNSGKASPIEFNRIDGKKKLHPFCQVLKDAVTEFVKTHKKTDIARSGIMSITRVDALIKGKSAPTTLTPKLRLLIKFLGYEDESAWIGKAVRISPVLPIDPETMLKDLLKTDRATVVIDMLSTFHRDEFSSVDG